MFRHLALFVLLSLPLWVSGCSGDKSPATVDTADTVDPDPQDGDRDGYYDDEDCDDADAGTHPGAAEICDDVDNDCDGEVDEGVERAYYEDGDGDGFGDADAVVYGCSAPDGAVPVGNDCDDAEPRAFPGGTEVCDGVDNDCDGETDEGSEQVWYTDADGDGFGAPGSGVSACERPEGAVEDNSDCDDGAAEVNPDADEVCDGVDNDCDGETDGADALDKSSFYQDRDEDGYGDPARTTTACEPPAGYVADATDCDDLDPVSFPGADEVCDSADNDCDGETDEDAVDGSAFYTDGDGDGYGDPALGVFDCAAPAGTVADATDCDDGRAGVHPGATETCDGEDDDCDGETDEDSSADAVIWYGDDDDDGFGSATDTAVSCAAPSGYVASSADCDDTDDAVNPDAVEVCDGVDNDCDDAVDETASADAATWYQDRDDDGFGDADREKRACEAPDGYVADDTDCDDLDASSFPGGVEVCDSADNDCDGSVDEAGATGGTKYYPDGDGDTYGDKRGTALERCTAPSGYVTSKTDCDDDDASVHPGADEVCDDQDNDCDGSVDEAGALGTESYYPDDDSDGYGDDAATAVTGCDAPTGYVADHTDCDDANADVNPGETETCDGTDNDCSGDESNTVTFTSSAGVVSDVSATWTAGRATAPATITASAAGAYAICPGTYYVSVTASASSLSLSGPYGADVTTLSGGGTSRVLYTTKPLTLSDLTLAEGAAGTSATAYGGNLYTSSTLSATDVVLDSGTAVRGGNLYCTACTMTLDGVDMISGEADYGGAMYAVNGAITATDLLMYDNNSDYGGAIYGSKLTGTLTSSTISGGYATQYGGGVYLVNSSNLALSDSEILENAASNGGGAYLSAATLSMSSGSNIDGNTASLLGGGLYLASTAAFSCTGSSSLTAGVWGNTATAAGGAYVSSTSATITSTTCDWTGTEDNSLYDIVLTLYYFNYGNNASFTCSGYSCS